MNLKVVLNGFLNIFGRLDIFGIFFSSWAGCLLRGRVSVTGVGYLLHRSGICYVGRVFVTWSDVCYVVGCLLRSRMSLT